MDTSGLKKQEKKTKETFKGNGNSGILIPAGSLTLQEMTCTSQSFPHKLLKTADTRQ